MATNYYQEGKVLTLPTVSGAVSGDTIVAGDFMPGVLLTDADGASPYEAQVQVEGVFLLSCHAHDGSTGSKIEVGDVLFWTNKATPLRKNAAQKVFGIALAEVESADTATIPVRLTPRTFLPEEITESEIGEGAVTETKIGADAVTTVKIEDGAVTTGKLDDEAVTSDKVAEGVIQYAEVNLSAAQIKTLKSANSNKGLPIVAAPGEDKMIEFISATLFYDYDGASAYTAANGLTFRVETTAVSALIGTTLLEATADTVAVAQALSATVIGASAGLVNKPLYLNEGTTDPTGSATAEDQLLVRVAYRIHDFDVGE